MTCIVGFGPKQLVDSSKPWVRDGTELLRSHDNAPQSEGRPVRRSVFAPPEAEFDMSLPVQGVITSVEARPREGWGTTRFVAV